MFQESVNSRLEEAVVTYLQKEFIAESATTTISKFMLKIIPDRVKSLIPDITATISKELSDSDINGILDKLLQDKETFQRIAQKLMDRLMNSRC